MGPFTSKTQAFWEVIDGAGMPLLRQAAVVVSGPRKTRDRIALPLGLPPLLLLLHLLLLLLHPFYSSYPTYSSYS